MKRVNREELLQCLEAVQSGLSPREIIDQSSCVVFKDGEVLTYNDEVACRHKSPLKITGAIQANKFLEMLRKRPEDELDFNVREGMLVVDGKNRETELHMEKEILLPIGDVERPKTWNKLNSEFAEGIAIVQACAGNDESKMVLTCVHVAPKFVEACDNAQAARYKVKTGFEKSTLLKQTALKSVVGLGMTEFAETPAWVHFRNPAGLIMSLRRYTEDPKNLDPILAVAGEPITLPKGLVTSADLASIFSADNADDDQVTVVIRPGVVKLIGEGAAGRHTEKKKIKYDGPPLKFSIAPKMLMEIVTRHNECEIGPTALKVDGGKFVYVSCLSAVNDKD